MASFNGVSPSMATIVFLCVIISFASLSPNSKILVIISASLAKSTPCSCPSFTIEIISSSVTSPASSFSFIPKILRNIPAVTETSPVIGAKTHVRKEAVSINVYAHFSGYFAATLFGIKIPNVRII